MTRAIAVHGSDGKVMASGGRYGTYIAGKWRLIRVTEISPDESVPLLIRESLVGLHVATIFTGAELSGQLNPDAQFAYAPEVINVLEKAGKGDAAQELRRLASDEHDMYEFEPEIFETIG